MSTDVRFNPAPGWPPPPLSWVPGPGWRPDPAWPSAPDGWQFVVPQEPIRQRLVDFLSGRTTRRRPFLPVHPAPAPNQPLPTPPPPPSLSGGREGGRRSRGGQGGPRVLVPFPLWGQRGWPHREVVGESNYLLALERLCQEHRSDDQRDPDAVTVTAALVPEPSNPHDPHAVSVRVDGQVVGYLSRGEARRYSPVLRSLLDQGLSAEVQARIWGRRHDAYVGENRRGEPVYESAFHASVTLDLDEPHMIVPGNLPPTRAHALLPSGNTIQVHGEAGHLHALTPFVGPLGEQWVYVTLHEIVEQLARSTRTVVEVRIDGERVGQLSPKLSSDMLPAVRFLSERGLVPSARGKTRGNRAAVEVTLHVQRSHQLGDPWFEAVDNRAPN